MPPKAPQLTPQQQSIVSAFEELDAAIKSVMKNFGRVAMEVDAMMMDQAGIERPKAKPALTVVKEDDEIPGGPSAEDIIESARKALGKDAPESVQ